MNTLAPKEWQEVFERAVVDHQNGRLPEAEEAYGVLLASDPESSPVMNLIALLWLQTGRAEKSAPMFDEAIKRDPKNWVIHANRGQALESLKRFEDASSEYEKAIKLQPSVAELYEALGVSLQRLGRHRKAVEAFDRAIQLNSDLPSVYTNRGISLERLGKWNQAAQSHSRAVRLAPTMGAAHFNLACVLHRQRFYEKAAAHFHKAVELEERPGDAHIALGKIYQKRMEHDRALEHYQQGIAAGGEYDAEDRVNIAVTMQELLLLDEADRMLQEAIDIDPEVSHGKYNQFYSRLLRGDFQKGLEAFERRDTYRERPEPRWLGEDFHGKRLLIYFEQGVGDLIQFARYFPMVRERGEEVVLECPRSAMRLMETVDGALETVAKGDPLPEVDLQIPVGSLPYVFQTRTESIPGGVPYVHVPPADNANLSKATSERPLRVGIAWAGSPVHGRDRHRSCKLTDFDLLAEVPGVEWFSLHKDDVGDQFRKYQGPLKITEYLEDCRDYYDTAQKLHGLDLVISVDTSIIHLTGAMGRPVWVLVQYAPDWRWFLEWEDSPWYPSLRLFRQERYGDWGGAFQKVLPALRDYPKAR